MKLIGNDDLLSLSCFKILRMKDCGHKTTERDEFPRKLYSNHSVVLKSNWDLTHYNVITQRKIF